MNIRVGHLVKADGCFGIVVLARPRCCMVFTGNGLLSECDNDKLEVVNLPNSDAPHNFNEIIRKPKMQVDLRPLFNDGA